MFNCLTQHCTCWLRNYIVVVFYLGQLGCLQTYSLFALVQVSGWVGKLGSFSHWFAMQRSLVRQSSPDVDSFWLVARWSSTSHNAKHTWLREPLSSNLQGRPHSQMVSVRLFSSTPKCDCYVQICPKQSHKDGKRTKVWFNWTKEHRSKKLLNEQQSKNK